MSVELHELENINKKFSNTPTEPDRWDKLYCGGLMFNSVKNTGARLILATSFQEQRIIPEHPEFAKQYTGYENSFGKYADSTTKCEKTSRVVCVISKFPTLPRHIYLYVVQDILTGVYDVIEIKHYESYAESHGYIKPETEGDYFMPGSIIPENTILSRAPSIDSFGNYRTGVNAMVASVSWSDNEEDGFVLSDEFAEKTTYTQIKEGNITVNKNIILTNLYGDNEDYKAFPDIGEEVRDGIICVSRQINYSFAASDTTRSALKSILDSDTVLHGTGKIIDIDVFINDEEELKNNTCRNQITKYWVLSKLYHQKIIDELGKIINKKGNRYTYKLQMIYERSRDFMNPDIKFSSNNGVFEFGFITFVTAYKSNLKEGSKMTDRAASKGVVCHIKPKAMMPRDKWGNVADIIQSPPSFVGRSNSDQSYEPEKNFIAFHVRKLMAQAQKHGVEKQFAILYDFIEGLDKPQAEALRLMFDNLSEIDKQEYILDNIMNGIYIRQGPTNNASYKQICQLYDKYKIKPDRVRVQRQIKKHGFNRNLLIDKDDSLYALYKDNKGKLLAKSYTPYDLEEQQKYNKETYGDDEYLYGNEFSVPNGENKDDESIRLIRKNDDDTYNILGTLRRKTIDEIIDEGWTDETYLVAEDEETITLSFLSQEPVIVAEKFYLILEHVPEGKFSARFVGSANPLGLPNKSGKSENSDSGAYGNSPIKYGEMEVNNALIRVDPAIVFRFLSTVSSNPELGNELFYNLLYKDPLRLHNLSKPITDICNTTPAKQLEVYLFCLGLEVLNTPDDDIYSAFDDREYSDAELEAIFTLQAEKYKPEQIYA